MNQNLLDINKTKYRYLMDNIDLSKEQPILKYCIPVPKGEEKLTDEFYNRDYPDVTISNYKFVKMIDKVANSLVAYGIKAGDVVTVCQTNTPEIMYMDYALNKIGACANYIYPNITAEEMKYYIEELNSKCLFILDDNDIKQNVEKATENSDIKIISSSVIESFPLLFKMLANKKNSVKSKKLKNEIRWAEFLKLGKNINANENEYISNSVCSYMHTSGTSSVPKAVMVSNENLNAIPFNYEYENVKWCNGYLAVQTIPQFVAYGETTNHLFLCNNVCVVLIPEMNPKNYYDLMNKYHPQYSFATPSHARELLKRNVDMTDLLYICFGGDGFDDVESLLNEYLRKNNSKNPAYQGFGSTEMSATAGISNIEKYHKVGSIGKPLGKTKAMILEPGTFNVITTPNTEGELCLTGPGMTLGYAGNSKEDNDSVYVKHPDGTTWVHMGDLVSFDKDGFYYYHGRIKNVIVRKSFKFAPKEIVDAIMLCPNVKQCIVFGKYDAEEGQVPSAHIVLNDNSNVQASVDKIVELVNANVQEFHRPVVYKIKDSIVTTRNNKININALKIEDIATIVDGVNDAEISLSADNDYDYNLKIYTDFAVDEQKAIDFIKQTSKNEKVLNGKIKYIFIQKKGKSYYRYEK